MSTATFSVGPGESYRDKRTGRVVTLGRDEPCVFVTSRHHEKIHTGSTVNVAPAWPTPNWAYVGAKPASDIPAFVEPERPAEPKPEPDSPAVALLRRLLKDREARADVYGSEIEYIEEAIAAAERSLQRLRDDLEHKHRCADAVTDEIAQISTDIRRLGGEV